MRRRDWAPPSLDATLSDENTLQLYVESGVTVSDGEPAGAGDLISGPASDSSPPRH